MLIQSLKTLSNSHFAMRNFVCHETPYHIYRQHRLHCVYFVKLLCFLYVKIYVLYIVFLPMESPFPRILEAADVPTSVLARISAGGCCAKLYSHKWQTGPPQRSVDFCQARRFSAHSPPPVTLIDYVFSRHIMNVPFRSIFNVIFLAKIQFQNCCDQLHHALKANNIWLRSEIIIYYPLLWY